MLQENTVFKELFLEVSTESSVHSMLEHVSVYDILPNGIAGIFEKMKIAEEVIDEYQEKYPKMAEKFDRCFMMLRPTNILGDTPSKDVYRSHCSELLERVANGGTVIFPTIAEKIMVLSALCARAPLNHDASILMYQLFIKIFPERADIDNDGTMNEKYQSYKGRIDEIESDIAKKLMPDIKNTREDLTDQIKMEGF